MASLAVSKAPRVINEKSNCVRRVGIISGSCLFECVSCSLTEARTWALTSGQFVSRRKRSLKTSPHGGKGCPELQNAGLAPPHPVKIGKTCGAERGKVEFKPLKFTMEITGKEKNCASICWPSPLAKVKLYSIRSSSWEARRRFQRSRLTMSRRPSPSLLLTDGSSKKVARSDSERTQLSLPKFLSNPQVS